MWEHPWGRPNSLHTMAGLFSSFVQTDHFDDRAKTLGLLANQFLFATFSCQNTVNL